MFSLWDRRSYDPVAEYDTREEALALVLEGIRLNGPNDTDTLYLVRDWEDGRTERIAYGHALAELAVQELGQTHPAALARFAS